MKKNHLSNGSIALLAAALLSGCNDNDDNLATKNATPAAATTQVTITPSLGKILNAKVVLKNAKNGAMLGEGTTGNTGVATFTATKTADPVVVEVMGVDGAQGAMYFDEAKNANVPFPSSKKIRAIAPTLENDANIGVSVLTELAAQTAEKALDGSLANATSTIVNDANNKVKMLLAKELGEASLLTPPTIIATDSVVKDLITASNAANDYAIKLAALAKLGTGDTPVLDLLQKLSDDISDGSLDGKKGETGISYNHDTSSFNAALDSYLTNYVDQAQLGSIYTSQVLTAFNITNGSIIITVGGTGGGTGSGQNCALNANYNISGISASYSICYTNFPQNAVCGAGNSAFSSTSIPGYTGSISWTYSQVATCPAGSIQINYLN